MPLLTIELLGRPRVSLADQPLEQRQRKELALLAFLAVEQEHRHSRDSLLGLFWPDVNEDAARNNLRVVLAGLRRQLGQAGDKCLAAERQHVRFVPESDHALDVRVFRALLAEVRAHAHSAVERCEACVGRLAKAAELYRGDFLAGFSLSDSAPFDEWATVVREQLHQQQIEAVETLTAAAELRGDHAGQVAYARRQLALEPWRESAYAQLMRGLWASGQRNAALEQFETCRRVLADELGLEPSPELVALAEQLRAAAMLQAVPATFATEPSFDWPAIPEVAHLYGRDSELAQLERWLADDRCRLIALLGIGGVGKTTLAAAAARAVAGRFEAVVWRSLLNAPPLDELLRDVLGQLEPGAQLDLPGDGEAQIGRLMAALRRTRCLLILDNLESILRPDQPGVARPGYAGYVQLLRAAAERPHQSCVLLTSRERPQGTGQLAEDTPLVQLLRLGGLDAAGGVQMLAARGLTKMSGIAGELVQRYSGNPLALRLVAQTVREMFDGDTHAFLETEAPIFDDIGAVLDQQMARLNPLEQAILFWLAIEREPISAATLRAALVPHETSRAVLEALRALQHRSLLETAGDGFTLQNVLLEYLTERLVSGVCAELLSGDQENNTLPSSLSPSLAVSTSHVQSLAWLMINRFALLKAQAKEYVRQSQARLIVQPIAEQLVARLGKARLAARARSMLEALRVADPLAPGYLAGNLLNLLLHLKIDVSGYDLSRLNVWQADLRGVAVTGVNFAEADLRDCAFTLTISTFAIWIDRSEQMLIAAPVHGDLCLWKAANGQLHDAFRTPSKGAAPLIFSQDGQYLAGGCLDHTVRLWSVETGATLQILAGHSALACALAFRDDGALLASSSLDNTIRLWDVRTGRCLQTVGHRGPGCPPLAFRPALPVAGAPGPTVLASGGSDYTIEVWDIERGQVIDTLHGHTREIERLAFSPDGRLLASGSHDGTILLWDVSRHGHGRLLGSLQGHRNTIRVLVFHPSSTVLASGGADCTIRLWDCSTLRARQILQGHASEVTLLAFNMDGTTLASGSSDRMIRRWDVQTGRALDSLNGYIGAIHALHFRPDGRHLASAGADGMIRLWEAGRGQLERSWHAHAGQVQAVAFSPDGRVLASGGADGLIQLWDAASGQALRTLRGHIGAIKSLAVHPDGILLASGGVDHTIRLWPMAGDISTGSGARILRGHTDEVSAVAFSPDGRLLASASSDHTIQLWAIDRGEPIQRLIGHTAALTAAAFNPDGTQIASISFDNTIYVWDIANGRSSAGWEGVRAGGRVVTFSPQGEWLVHAAEEVMLVVRDVRTGNIVQTLQGHTSTIVGLHWSPTEPFLASSGWDETIRVWDVNTGACLHVLRAPGPYAGMNIAGVTGISDAQKAALRALGAIEAALRL